MKNHLDISIGEYSSAGLKEINQDCHGHKKPDDSLLTTKGIAIALADGISSSDVSQIASEAAINGFLDDYYCTSESWSVKASVEKVLLASNSWLWAQNQRNHEYRLNRDKGMVCTFSGLIFKSNHAYSFHIGDAQIARFRSTESEHKWKTLTNAHRVQASPEQSYLARALGMKHDLEIDFNSHPLNVGDIFVLSTDGIHEFVNHDDIQQAIEQSENLNAAAKEIAEKALELRSNDNITIQIVRVNSLPERQAAELVKHLSTLPFPPKLRPRAEFDGFKIIREIHISSRSHVWLALDLTTKQDVVLKMPSTEGRLDNDYLQRFLIEEWIAKRIDNPHVLKPFKTERKQQYLYIATEFVKGQTLTQWMIDNPVPNLETVRQIIEQIAQGLQAFHRQEMLHQDLRPNNIIIDESNTVKIIDFGSTYVAGIEEIQSAAEPQWTLGTAQFMAPEYLLGLFGTKRSDLYSLACISYHMLSGRSPYGTAVFKAHSRYAQRQLRYQSVLDPKRSIPAWVDLTLKKALQVDPDKRYQELSEFIYDLRQPNRSFANQTKAPLLQRNPVRFWQGVSALLTVAVIFLLSQL